MAFMLPRDVTKFKTEGEQQVYHFFRSVAQPDAQYLCWYTPDVQDREPDFVLFCKKTGIVILEVKDWSLEQIREANKDHFILAIRGNNEKRQNPISQAQDYKYQLMDRLKKDGRLISKDPSYHGNPTVPIQCGVIFPNINKLEYTQKELDKVIPTDKTFFWDDLHPASDICTDTTGNCFTAVFGKMFPPKFQFALTGKEIDHLKHLLFPTIKINLPERESDFSYPKRVCRLKGLDHHQESLARKFDGGHRIIVGPSGSGKTLILVHKAAFLKQYNPNIHNILCVCFNITLVNYIKRLLAGKSVPFGEDGIQVMHFYELCAGILGEEIAFENEDSSYYELVIEEVLDKVKECGMRFDAILVDEGQDFSDKMFKVITGLLNPKTDSLTIALDDNQNIYRKQLSWKEVGVKAKGRVHKISYGYRNTREIAQFANRFIGAQKSASADQGQQQLDLFPDFFDFSGPKPEIKQFPDWEAIVVYVADQVIEVQKQDQCPYSEIGIIYTLKSPDKTMPDPLPVVIGKALESRGILSNWVAENYLAKRSYDITTNSVTISTIHSAKGLDFSHVFLLGLDCLGPGGWTKEQIHNLVYVAITRARYRLFIPYILDTVIVNRIKVCL